MCNMCVVMQWTCDGQLQHTDRQHCAPSSPCQPPCQPLAWLVQRASQRLTPLCLTLPAGGSQTIKHCSAVAGSPGP